MTKVVIDAYAWIAYLEGSEEAIKLRELVKSNTKLYTNIVTVAEIVSKVKRTSMDVETAIEAISSLSIVINIDFDFSKDVGILHAEIRKKIKDFGLADTFVLLTARKLKAKILTGDPHFKGFKETIMI